MDQRLEERLNKWHSQIQVVEQAEKTCLLLESQEKPMWSKMFLSAPGKTVADREAQAYQSIEWETLQRGLVEARVNYNRERRILELKQAAFQSEYLGAKHESEAIARIPRGMT